MSTQTVFNQSSAEGDQTTESQGNQQEAAQQQQQQPASPESVFANQLAEIRNEKGEPKYKDLTTALEALKHSQEYIPSLRQEKETYEQEVTRLRAELEQRKSVEEVMDRLVNSGVKPDQSSGDDNQQQQPQAAQGLSQEQLAEMLEKLVPNYINQHQEQTKAQQNIQSVDTALRETFGEKVGDVVLRKAKELNLTPQELEKLSAKSPQMVLSLFDVKQQSKPNKPNTSSVNLPVGVPSEQPLQKPERSLLSGATSKQQAEFNAQIRRKVYEKYGITE